MRRLSFAVLLGLMLAMATVAPTLASGGSQGPHIAVWGTINSQSHDQIDGTFTVPTGSQGGVWLALYGSNNGSSWNELGQTFFKIVKGQTSYGFSFDIDSDSHHYKSFKVGGDGAESRKVDRDECGYRVPEAPSSSLLIFGALPAVGLLAIKATGIRLPRPHLHRIG